MNMQRYYENTEKGAANSVKCNFWVRQQDPESNCLGKRWKGLGPGQIPFSRANNIEEMIIQVGIKE